MNNMYINPENSFLDKLDSHNIIEKQEIKYAKYDYELSKPLLCLNLNLITCSLLINKKDLNEFTILILGTKKQYSFIIKKDLPFDFYSYVDGTSDIIFNIQSNDVL